MKNRVDELEKRISVLEKEKMYLRMILVTLFEQKCKESLHQDKDGNEVSITHHLKNIEALSKALNVTSLAVKSSFLKGKYPMPTLHEEKEFEVTNE